MKSLSHAEVFHEIAEDSLARIGFSVIKGPTAKVDTWQSSGITYKNDQGLVLRVGFTPIDGNYTSIDFGRVWQTNGAHPSDFLLSNSLYTFAKKFEQNFSDAFELKGISRREVCQSIFEQLTIALPAIMLKLNEKTLLEIENFGELGVNSRIENIRRISELKGFGESAYTPSIVTWPNVE